MKFIEKKIIRLWLPLILFLLSLLSFSYSGQKLWDIIHTFFLVSSLILFSAGIFNFIKKKWMFGLIQLGVLSAGIITLMIIIFVSLSDNYFDGFASNLEIPENVELEYPIYPGMYEESELEKPYIENKINQFRLFNSFQPGLYDYDMLIKTDKSGIVYLKAFELTKEVELSKSRLKERSTIHIPATNGEYLRFISNNDFTIYEGDWGEPYAARFELWFLPDGEAEIKLLEKNYVIEGWMR